MIFVFFCLGMFTFQMLVGAISANTEKNHKTFNVYDENAGFGSTSRNSAIAHKRGHGRDSNTHLNVL